jgi:sugar (pentulose or hexulose) kinase
MNSLLLGIDVGTTATKAILVTPEGRVVSEGRSEYQTHHLQAGWVEQDPQDWWSALCVATNSALDKTPGARILGVAISSQAPTFIAVDKDGIPLRRALIWMDRRAQSEANELLRRIPNISQITGNRADPYYVAAKILWFIKNEPGLFAKTKYFLQIPGYLNFKLTNKFGIDKPHASLLQLRKADQSDWSPEILEAVGVDASFFPEIGECSQLQGEVSSEASEESGIPKGTPVFFGSVDGASAAVEAGAIEPGIVAEMTGTSTVLIAPTSGTARDPAFVAMAHAIPGLELQLGAMVANKWGRIISISSQVALTGSANHSHYATAKAGLLGFTYSAAKELGTFGITVNAILPGRIETDMITQRSVGRMDEWMAQTPLNRLGKPDEIASVVSFIASGESSYVTGAAINVSGGLVMG